MASDNSSQAPGGEHEDAAALAQEVKSLRALLEELQAELKPAVQSSLRERSSELQRAGADLAELQAEKERLEAALAEAEARAAGLQEEAARWRTAARQGLDEISERTRRALARLEREGAELSEALALAKAQLDASKAEVRLMVQARDMAREEGERRQRQIASLRAKVRERERKVAEMAAALEAQTAAVQAAQEAARRATPMATAVQGLLVRGARLRRRLLKG